MKKMKRVRIVRSTSKTRKRKAKMAIAVMRMIMTPRRMTKARRKRLWTEYRSSSPRKKMQCAN